jgi:multicomponent Na+:H+ antiporter subunit B
MDITLLLEGLLFFMIIAALIAVETSDLLSSIISVGAVGFLLSIAFLLLGAPDIAITQIVVEVLCLVILIRATINRDLTTINGDREFFGMVITIVIVFAISVVGLRVMSLIPSFGIPVMDRIAGTASADYLANGLKKTGDGNIVTAILFDFRAYDTLGQAAVFFCGILGALTILRRKAHKKIEDIDDETGEQA